MLISDILFWPTCVFGRGISIFHTKDIGKALLS